MYSIFPVVTPMSLPDSVTHAGTTAVQPSRAELLEFLQQHAPFKQMDSDHLSVLIDDCQQRAYSAGQSIIGPADGPLQHCYIVRQGRVAGKATGNNLQGNAALTAGSCFPLDAVLGERAPRTEHLAAESTSCLVFSREVFARLFILSAAFREHALHAEGKLPEKSIQPPLLRATETPGTQSSLDTLLAELVTRTAVTCSPDLPVHAAIKRMHEQHVGSIVITNEQLQPLGIFTLRDLRRVTATAAANLQQPISRQMTAKPFHLSPQDSAYDAALAMTERHIAHLCLVEKGKLCGVVSERDLFSLQRVGLVHLARTIRHADSLTSLIALRSDIRQLVERMLAHGASSTQVTRLVTLLNDHTLSRIIELNLQSHGDPGIAFTWLCFGSEGRREQALHTDQDNGMLFHADTHQQAEAARKRLLPLALRINHDLAACGLTLCMGKIMASNPELCLSHKEWSRRFAGILGESDPENLLGSGIFFDLRAVWGPQDECEALRSGLLAEVAGNRSFQRLMAENALRNRPPTGYFRDFVVARKGADKNTLDLKVHGLMPFVDAARLLALAHDVRAVGTPERLQALGKLGVMDAQDCAAYAEAYTFIQLTRLQLQQTQARAGLAQSNRLDPDTLNRLERRILRESFRQAQRLQADLAQRYQL